MWEALLDWLAPRASLCGILGTWITIEESRALRGGEPIVHTGTVLRRGGVRALDRVVAAGNYRNPLLREALHRFKYGGSRAYDDLLVKMLCEAWGRGGATGTGDAAVCPVPLHWLRRMRRGFNQAILLAQGVAQERSLPLRELLTRSRATGSQVGRTVRERRRAMRGAFHVTARDVPATVILVDDVLTTGATLDACAAALKECGASRVEGLVVATAFRRA